MIFPWQIEDWKRLERMRMRLPQAILIHGRAGTGLFEFATEFTQALLCEAPSAEGFPCNRCLACRWFAQGNHPDFRSVRPANPVSDAEGGATEKKSEQIRVEQIRALRDFLVLGTHRHGSRVVLIFPAEAMNAVTQNALLKSLEEPVAGTLFVLASHRPEGLLPTVRSRCARFALSAADREVALHWLKAQGIEDAETALAESGGAPLDAAAAAQTAMSSDRLARELHNADPDPVLLADQFQNMPLAEAVTRMQRWCYDLLSWKFFGKVYYHPKHERLIAETSSRLGASELAAYWRRLNQAKSFARHPLNTRLFLEDIFFQYRQLGR